MTPIIPLLFEALAVGAVRFDFGRIDDYGGYLSPRRRVITLNPDAPATVLEETLAAALTHLAEPLPVEPEQPAVRPVLALVHSVAEVELPAPRGDPDESPAPYLQVVG